MQISFSGATSGPPSTIPALKGKIRDELYKISTHMVIKEVKRMNSKVNKIVMVRGKQFEGVK